MISVDAFGAVQANLLSPVVLCFFLGCVSTLVKSDLRIPESVYSLLTIYLLFALGLKGGVELSHADLGSVWKPALATLGLGLLTPLIAYFVARTFGKLSVPDAAALAAHYGSVSVVTFIATQAFLNSLNIAFEGFLSTLVVILEAPAILVSLLLARLKSSKEEASDWSALRSALHEILSGRSLLLLIGGLVIGALSGPAGYARVEPLFGAPFQGVVALFLLEMGIVASKRFRDLKKVGVFVVLFGTIIPVINGILGSILGHVAGLSLGGTVVLSTLAASASYIAAPAAVRVALPEANPGLYLTSALTVTFPFNLVIGIPLYLKIAHYLKDLIP
ncbi:sodium-dependent bicarbonate transport family permease [bacterium]|nr:sodium-dependent bicarbonate transport family permease [bacterium]